jgi:hypothetical protein
MNRRLKDEPVLLSFSPTLTKLEGKTLQLVTPQGQVHQVRVRISNVADGCTVMITNGVTHYLTEEAVAMIKLDETGKGFVLSFAA